MRWFRFGSGPRPDPPDPDRQQALLEEVRQAYGAHAPAGFDQQAAQVTGLLTGDDGLLVAARILREVTDQAYAELHAQAGQWFPVDRRNYRPLWREAGPHLRWPLFSLPGGLHPYVQVVAAVTVAGAQARRLVRVTAPEPVLAHLFEVLDLLTVGWEFGRLRVDADAATLADRLIATARDLRGAMSDPPPLPPPARELMRRNNTIEVLDPAGHRIVGAINPGAEMRQSLLV